jgi:hypothetical protein
MKTIAKVTGFDTISVTQTMGIGHGYYAAPEMYTGVEYTNRVNVFSFAVMAHEILVSRRVFVGWSGRGSVPASGLQFRSRCQQLRPN